MMGVAVAYGTGRLLESLLAGVSPADGVTFTIAVAMSIAMTGLAGLPPALRAACRSTALRAE